MKRLPLIAVALIVFLVSSDGTDARRRHHHHTDANGNSVSLAGLPEPLVEKVTELVAECDAKVTSTFRPGARVRGSGSISNHALHKAADLKGDPKCIYAHMKEWKGGYSTDYHRVGHIHISYNRKKEWGARFAHYGGGRTRLAAHGRHHRTMHARRHYRSYRHYATRQQPYYYYQQVQYSQMQGGGVQMRSHQ